MTKLLPQRLDDLVNATGLPVLLTTQPRRRPMRGLAAICLLFGTIGMGIGMLGADRYWIGDAALMIGFTLSVWLPIFGPIKPWASTSETVDEYDEDVRARAYLTALPAILIVGALSLFGLPLIAALQRRNPWETIALCGMGAIYLILLWNAIPTLQASWERPLDDD